MQRFFIDYSSLHSFSLSLGFHRAKLECQYCHQNEFFVSHGIVYKQRSIDNSEKVGKRLFCSNRYGRSGCGRTFQLYVSGEVPYFRYGAAALFIFITQLLALTSIKLSYQQATGQTNSRNASRWVNRLMARLGDYRSFLNRPIDYSTPKLHRITRLSELLETLSQLSLSSKLCPCLFFQFTRQNPLI